jgi:hypothetical protein
LKHFVMCSLIGSCLWFFFYLQTLLLTPKICHPTELDILLCSHAAIKVNDDKTYLHLPVIRFRLWGDDNSNGLHYYLQAHYHVMWD